MGFAGSFHCLGMCGPIAMGISGRNTLISSKLTHHFLYFFGKTTTYGLLGLIFGFFGQGLVLAGWQQALSIIMGAIMLGLVFISIFKSPWLHHNKFTNWFQNKLITTFGHLFKRPGLFSTFLLGLLNGLLPCGLVYIGLTAAVATGSAMVSAMYMLVFGLGTMPVMLAFLIFTQRVSYTMRLKLSKVTPVLMALVGTLLILRGLDLGIPYVSPFVDSLMLIGDRGDEAEACHP